MLCGLLAIARTMEGRYESAAWLVLLCVLIDKLDGSFARLFNASSKFGVELDSFSDFVTFGIAPGLLVLGLVTDPELPYAAYWTSANALTFVRGASAFFIVMAALRLAKFNVLTEEIGSRVFLGIPTTHTGALSCCFLLTVWKYDLPAGLVAYYPIVLVVLGLWMVSNVPMPKLRPTDSRGYNAFLIVNAVAAYVLVPLGVFTGHSYPEYLFALSSGYAVIGTLFAVTRMSDLPTGHSKAGEESHGDG